MYRITDVQEPVRMLRHNVWVVGFTMNDKEEEITCLTEHDAKIVYLTLVFLQSVQYKNEILGGQNNENHH